MKTKSLFSAILMFCMLTVLLPLRAQTYSSTIHRSHLLPYQHANSSAQVYLGGSSTMGFQFGTLSATVRGVPQFTGYTDNTYTITEGVGRTSDYDVRRDWTAIGGNMCVGHPIWDYVDLTSKLTIDCMAGQDFILSATGNSWSNAVLFIDWDGNGSFDDHDPEAYNLYGWSDMVQMEYAGSSPGPFRPSWEIRVPKTFTKEFTTRIRVRVDEGVLHETNNYFSTASTSIMSVKGFPIWNAAGTGIDNSTPRLGNNHQKFFSTYLWRFMPSGQMFKGCTVDLTLHITPDPLTLADDGKTVQDNVVVVGTGNIPDCMVTTSGTAITNEAGFEAFLAATSGNYYLANDITISSTLDVSTSEFAGTFDGNGHTITINPTTAAKQANVLKKDECFYPYGLTDYSTFNANTVADAVADNMIHSPITKDYTPTMTNYPQKVIAGGFCGVLKKGGVIKNVKVVYAKDVVYSTFNGSLNGTLFGLVAGINKGTIENVSVDIQSGKTVNVGAHWNFQNEPSALGGIAGVLYRGIVKNCAVNVDGTFRFCRATSATGVNTTGTLGRNSCMGGLIGRLQCGVVSNVRFSGASTGVMSMCANGSGYSRFCLGGIAGMLYTPQGCFGGQTALQDFTWGYDNGTTHPDVNNVIISYAGSMTSESGITFSETNVFHRGLLFAEATDTVLVPNLVTQYATRPTDMANASTNTTLTGTAIPLISRAKGHINSDNSILEFSNVVGQIYLGTDSRVEGRGTANTGSWLNVSTVTDTKLDFAQVVDPTYCTAYSTPYVVATYTGTNPAIKGITGESSNVTWQEDKDGNPYVQIATDPTTYTASSWTWSTTESTPGGGGGGGGSAEFSCSEKTEDHGYCATPVTSGTAISSAAEWDAMSLSGTYYLTKDITVSGFNKGAFSGSLYGNGHTITIDAIGSKTVGTNASRDYMGGLFTYITGTGTIQDLVIVYNTQRNFTVTSTTNPLAVGLLAGASSAKISNVRVVVNKTITVGSNASTPESSIGGILGSSALGGALTNVTFEDNGRLTSPKAKNVAGIVGVAETTNLIVSNAVVRGTGDIRTELAGNVAGVTNPKDANVSLNGFVYALTKDPAMVRSGSTSPIGRVYNKGTYLGASERYNPSSAALNGYSQYSTTYSTAKMIDGSTTTYFRSYQNQNTANSYYITFNLGSLKDIDKVYIKFTGSNYSPNTFKIEYEKAPYNSGTWADYKTGIAGGTANEIAVGDSIISTGKLRLRVTSAKSYPLRINYVQVGAKPTATVNTPSRYYIMDNAGAVPANDYTTGNYTSMPIYNKVVKDITCDCYDIVTPAESPVTTYAGNYANVGGNVTRTDRYISSLTVNGTTITGLRSGAGAVYFDKRSNVITAEKGSTVSLSSEGAGVWMHTFIYVDWNNDGDFTDGYTVWNGSGDPVSTTGGEWVYNNAVAGSQSFSISSSFTIPANQQCGVYNVRYKVDWATNNPEGNSDIATNGGEIIDFKIEIPCDPGGATSVCGGVTSKTDLTSTVQAYIKDGNLTLASCDIATLAPEEIYSVIYNECTPIAFGTAVPTAEAYATGSAPSAANHLYLAVTDKATGVNVIARCGSAGGGWVSDDMGRTKSVEMHKNPYGGEMFTAVPDGPFVLEGWYLSTDGGTTFTRVGEYMDYTYMDAEDAIIEARFTFTDYQGNFGTYKFTSSTVVPYYVKEISSTGGEINISPARASGFSGNVISPNPRLRYLSDAYIGMKPTTLLPNQVVTVTVTMADMGNFPADARVLAFLDYNNNRWFDFDSNADGTTAGLTPNHELVFVANADGTVLQSKLGTPTYSASGNERTYTFQISNEMFPPGDLGTTRLRIYAGRYVDKYGLGPCNPYNNLAYRYDGAETANDRITLNDNNGDLYNPKNCVNLDNYVNVLDVNAEIMAFIPYDATWTIENGKNYVVRDLYIESAETDAGPQSGRITFDAAAPYGQLTVTGHIIVRKQLYKDRWHHVAFPMAMDGTSGTNGIKELDKTSGLDYKIANSQWLMMTFDPVKRNVKDGYNSGRSTPATAAYLDANTFYWIAADPSAGKGSVHTDDGGNQYTWFDFYSRYTNFFFEPRRSGTITFDETYRVKSDALFTDQNVFAIYNPFFSAIDTRELKEQDAVGGWEEIKVWNTKLERWIGIDPTTNFSIYPYTGWWIHLTEKAVPANDGTAYTINIGALQNGSDYAAADPHPSQTIPTSARRRDRQEVATTETAELPDAYFVGIDYVTNKENMNYISNTQVLLTTDGTSASTGDRHDAPVSFANAQARIPEIWTVAGTSTRMMQNDLQRADRVEVPMGIRIKQAGEYIIKLKSSNVEASHVYLVDKENGATVELKNAEQLLGGYEFLADAGDFDRFTLIIVNPKSETGLERVESDVQTLIYTTDDAVHFSNLPMGYTVGICDVVGRTLDSRLVNADQMELALPNNRGVYLINVRDQKGRVVETVKVVK